MTVPQKDEVVSTPRSATVGSGFADPGPLGLAGFAMTTFFLSTVNTNMAGPAVTGGVLGLAFFYGGLAQLLAGMWEFVKGNTFGAVAFASFGAFWMSYWYLVNHFPKVEHPVDANHVVGLFLLGWAIFTAYMTIAATRVSGVVLSVFFFLTLTFIALCIGAFSAKVGATNPDGWTKVGGWLGLVTAALAWYGSLAGVMNATAKRIVFPTWPR
jgi:succinate-acetate transporter protein